MNSSSSNASACTARLENPAAAEGSGLSQSQSPLSNVSLSNAASRRSFLGATSAAFAGLLASGCTVNSAASSSAQAAGAAAGGAGTASSGAGGAEGAGGAAFSDYGPLILDPKALLDLPEGFSYRVIAQLGDAMDDGLRVPDAADGMGCIDLGGGKIALVCNHELVPGKDGGGDIPMGFDRENGGAVMPGGTTTMVLDAQTLEVVQHYRSLAGTVRNCAGGVTPWGSWLTCEEAVFSASERNAQDHGWVFEVPANAGKLVNPAPLKSMGRFNHEAAAVDPETGIVYLTEDRNDSAFYRFIPHVPGALAKGGKLQALGLSKEGAQPDCRNWKGANIAVGAEHAVRWIDLDNVEAPEDDLRKRAALAGAAIFARGEGIHMGEDALYFCCTSGGAAKLGQIFRLKPGRGGSDDQISLFFESSSTDQFNYGDNLTVGPGGHLVVCEDQYTDPVKNHLRGITPDGRAYPLGLLRIQTEPAGACFSPDGKTMFVNAYSPAKTLAITGPWQV